MSKPASKAFALLLSALLATCWVVGEAWHLAPGMSHFGENCSGHPATGTAPDTTLAPPCHCTHGCFEHCTVCSLPILAIGDGPISRLLGQLHACGVTTSTVEPPLLISRDRVVFPAECRLAVVTRSAGARAPPA